MAVFACGKLLLACCSGSKVYVYSLSSSSDLSVTKLEVPVLTESKHKPENSAKARKNTLEEVNVTQVIFSRDEALLAIFTDNKDLAIWNTSTWNLLSSRKLVRQSFSACFSSNNKTLLVANKAGDLYSLDAHNNELEPHYLLGHVSMLLDVISTDDDKYVITCDRDEKIRISCYPNTYNIHSFCLGHTEFVINVQLLPANTNVLVSASGDDSIRFWNYMKGEELGCIPCNQFRQKKEDDLTQEELTAEKRITVKGCRCSSTHNTLAVFYSRYSEVSIFSAVHTGDSIDWSHVQNIGLEKEPWDVLFDPLGFLWILQPVKNVTLTVMKPVGSKKVLYELVEDSPDDTERIRRLSVQKVNDNWDFFTSSLDVQKEFHTLFKQWYDNVSEYLERKEERLSGAAKKIKSSE